MSVVQQQVTCICHQTALCLWGLAYQNVHTTQDLPGGLTSTSSLLESPAFCSVTLCSTTEAMHWITESSNRKHLMGTVYTACQLSETRLKSILAMFLVLTFLGLDGKWRMASWVAQLWSTPYSERREKHSVCTAVTSNKAIQARLTTYKLLYITQSWPLLLTTCSCRLDTVMDTARNISDAAQWPNTRTVASVTRGRHFRKCTWNWRERI